MVIKMGIEKKNFTFRLNEELLDKLRLCAKNDNSKLSNMVETILINYIEQKFSDDNGKN